MTAARRQRLQRLGREEILLGHTEHLAPAPYVHIIKDEGSAFAITATLAADLLAPRVLRGRTALTAPQEADEPF